MMPNPSFMHRHRASEMCDCRNPRPGKPYHCAANGVPHHMAHVRACNGSRDNMAPQGTPVPDQCLDPRCARCYGGYAAPCTEANCTAVHWGDHVESAD